MHKTDEKGEFKEWTPRPKRFREREFSRVKVGVADADGMDSWEEWRSAHPDRPGHGNIPLYPYKVPTTPETVVFRGPLHQPREVAPVDQNYDMTAINKPLLPAQARVPEGLPPVPVSEVQAARAAAPGVIVKDGIMYVPVTKQPAAPAPASPARPAMSAVGSSRAEASVDVPVKTKDEFLLKALHDVVEEMHASESEYSTLKNQLNVLQASGVELKNKATASQNRLNMFASEETRILGALEGDKPKEKETEVVPEAVPEFSSAVPEEIVPVEVPAPSPASEPPQPESESESSTEPSSETGPETETPPEPEAFPEPATSPVASQYGVSMKLGFNIPLSDFDDTKQQACARAISAAAGVDANKVSITGVDEAVEELAPHRRLLGEEKLASAITVSVSIEGLNEEDATEAASRLGATELNEELAKEELPSATIVEAAEVQLAAAIEEEQPAAETTTEEEPAAETPQEEAPAAAPEPTETPEESASEVESEIENEFGNFGSIFEGESRPEVDTPEDNTAAEEEGAPKRPEAPEAAPQAVVTDADDTAASASARLAPGFEGKFYFFGEEGPDFGPNLDVLTPNVERTSLVIMYDSSESFKAVDERMPDDHFAAQWTGKIEIKTSGDYNFTTASDDGSYLWIDGELIVNNGGLHALEEKQGSVFLGEGLHDLKVEFFETDGGAACMAKYQGADTEGNVQPLTAFHLQDTPEPEYTPVRTLEEGGGLSEGFAGEYFFFGEGGINIAPNLDVREPSLSKVTESINFESGQAFTDFDASIPSEHIAAKWTGLLKVDTTGSYTFTTTSDDGSFLWIDDNLVVNNGGLHGPESQDATLTLQSGYHRIRVEFFENSGGALCTAKYAGPDTADAELLIPAWHE